MWHKECELLQHEWQMLYEEVIWYCLMRSSGMHRTIVVTISGEKEMKKRSQVVQRDLPRPYDVNMSVLRPMGANDPQLSELQKARVLLNFLKIVSGSRTSLEFPCFKNDEVHFVKVCPSILKQSISNFFRDKLSWLPY